MGKRIQWHDRDSKKHEGRGIFLTHTKMTPSGLKQTKKGDWPKVTQTVPWGLWVIHPAHHCVFTGKELKVSQQKSVLASLVFSVAWVGKWNCSAFQNKAMENVRRRSMCFCCSLKTFCQSSSVRSGMSQHQHSLNGGLRSGNFLVIDASSKPLTTWATNYVGKTDVKYFQKVICRSNSLNVNKFLEYLTNSCSLLFHIGLRVIHDERLCLNLKELFQCEVNTHRW